MLKYFVIGSSIDADYVINKPFISERHFFLYKVSSFEFLIVDVSASREKLMVNRRYVKIAKVDRYTVLKLLNFKFTLENLFKGSYQLKSKQSHSYKKNKLILEPYITYSIGASNKCDVQLQSPQVAWQAATIIYKNNQEYLLVENSNKKKSSFFSGDSIFISPYIIKLNNDGEVEILKENAKAINVNNLELKHPSKKGKHLIKNLSISFSSGEFIGIIGPSGAGKSTLLKAIKSIFTISSGSIYLSKYDLAKNPQLLKEISYVPQDDIVIPELTVEENLNYASQLRLPFSWPKEERQKKIDEILNNTRLIEYRKSLVAKISGGQRKRLNLSLELLTEPSFLLADEVCSGLSALDADNILHYLRVLCNEGVGILLTIHSPDIEAFDIMDKLLVLDQGGIIAYYGPANEAISYFSKNKDIAYQSPKLIFDVLEKSSGLNCQERKTPPEEWAKIYRSSKYYQIYIASKLKESVDV